jgi:hypothetical protein
MAIPNLAFAQGKTTKPAATSPSQNPICQKVGKTLQLSSGGRMWCLGPQNGSGSSTIRHSITPKPPISGQFSANVNAANPAEDISPSGVVAYGQSETSVARFGNDVLEAWNDSTGFFSSCGSPNFKEELTGFGFSSDGGATFTDMGGLPNNRCGTNILSGDPSVEVWAPGGRVTFYVSSLYPSQTGDGLNYIGLNVCQLSGSIVNCGFPILMAASSQCEVFDGFSFCSFPDKDFLSIDPVRGRLYVSYTDFRFDSNGAIDLGMCDIGTPSGGIGPAGGTAVNPVCEGVPADTTTGADGAPYLNIATSFGCNELEGAYPAVDPGRGSIYVAYEDNWATNLFGCNQPTFNQMTFTAKSCLTVTPTSPCHHATRTNGVTITSMASAFIPGYNRFPMNDFPRVAFSKKYQTISMVWNDGRFHPTGDILMQSFTAVHIKPVCCGPIQLNSDVGGWNFMPATRQADNNGNINVLWYQRASGNTAVTYVVAAISVNPKTTSTPAANYLVTDATSDWNAVSSDIIPNFGDYTDLYLTSNCVNGTYSYLGQINAAWSDGRIGVPQPFYASGSDS